MATIEEGTGSDDELEVEHDSWEAYRMEQDPSTRLPDQYWNQLSGPAKKLWHQLDAADKKVLMPPPSAAPAKRQANMSNMMDSESEADLVVGDTSDSSLTVNKAKAGATNTKPQASPAHSAPQAKTNDKHPGDVRRMMSSGKREGNTVTLTPSKVSANTHAVFAKATGDDVESKLNAYWSSTKTTSPLRRPEPDPGDQDFRRGD